MSSDVAPVDGRSLRRERNVSAVLDAVHELLVDGHLDPPVEEVAQRSGVSLRSIYRYFPDREQLLFAALQRRLAAVDPVFSLEGVGEGSFDERLQGFLDHRLLLHELVAPTARVAVVVSRQVPGVAAALRERRTHLTEQVRSHFAPELARLGDDAEDAVLGLATLCQLESIEALRVERGLDDEQVRRILDRGARALLAA